jgi:hypothetical protein
MKTGRGSHRQDNLDIRALKPEAVMQKVSVPDPSHNRRVADDKRVVRRRSHDSPLTVRKAVVEEGESPFHRIDVSRLYVMLSLYQLDCLVEAQSYFIGSNDGTVDRYASIDLFDCPAGRNLRDLIFVCDQRPQRFNLDLNILAGRAFPVSRPIEQKCDVSRQRPDIMGMPGEQVSESKFWQKAMNWILNFLIEPRLEPLFPDRVGRVFEMMVEPGRG